MLGQKGFIVVPGPYDRAQLAPAIALIDAAVTGAERDEIHTGSTGSNVRTEGLLVRAPELQAIFTHPPLLDAARALIGRSFRLVSFHARSVLPGAAAQTLHQDAAPGSNEWPLLGFIFMVDAFCPENGATRFVPGSQSRTAIALPADSREEQACGPAGSMILFDGSVWHGFGANRTLEPRRSIYGSMVPSEASPAGDHAASLSKENLSRLPPQARHLLVGALS